MRVAILLLLFFYSSYLFGQNTDLIVTNTGDSIACAIQKVSKQKILYKLFRLYGDPAKEEIQLGQVVDYKYNFFEDYVIATRRGSSVTKGWRLRIAADFGVFKNTGLGETQSNRILRNYLDDLEQGRHAGAQVHYLLTNDLGIGFYTNFSNSNARFDGLVSVNIAAANQPPVWVPSKLSDNITVSYLAPSIGGGTEVFPNISFWASGSAGILNYKNQFEFLGEGIYTGRSFGWTWDLSVDIKIGRKISFGAQVGQLLGYLNKLEEERNGVRNTFRLESGSFVSIDRLNVSLGLRAFL